jgi:hypothetical protein
MTLALLLFNNMANFLSTIQPTTFGYYDSDADFQSDADPMIIYVKRALGDDVLTVELSKKQIWQFFEEAVTEWGALINQTQLESQFSSMLGMPTGSAEDLANLYLQPNVSFLERQAEAYANAIGIGGTYNSLLGSINLEAGRQDYNINTELLDVSGSSIFASQASGSVSKLKILEVFHDWPAVPVTNSNNLSNFQTSGFQAESYISDSRFHVLPLFEDILRATEFRTAQKMRRSFYSYEIHGKSIRVYPTPNDMSYNGFQPKLWMRVMLNPNAAHPDIDDDMLSGISSVSNAPLLNPVYSNINAYGRNWIKKYTLALCKQLLGRIRIKVGEINIPGGTTIRLDGESLLSESKEDKDKLIDNLKEWLSSMTYEKVMEREVSKAENMQKQLRYIPFMPHYIIFRG